MSTQVYTSYLGSISLGTSVFVQIRNPSNGTALVPRTNTGIREDVSASGFYTWSGAVTTELDAYEAIWDENNGLYAGEIVVPRPTISATSPVVLPAGGVSPVVTQSFFIKRGDNEPLVFAVTELDATGAAIPKDVTGWTGKFKLRATPDVGTVLINQDFYISDQAGNVTTNGTFGLLGYDWGLSAFRTGETDRLGTFFAEFECHRADGTKKTYPTTSVTTNEYITVVFVADLDDAGSH